MKESFVRKMFLQTGKSKNLPFTPGTWRVDFNMEGGDYHWITASDGIVARVDVCAPTDGDMEAEGKANARLIAAAPEILRVLQRLANAADDVGVRHFDTDTMSNTVTEMQRATEAARAVITKATHN